MVFLTAHLVEVHDMVQKTANKLRIEGDDQNADKLDRAAYKLAMIIMKVSKGGTK